MEKMNGMSLDLISENVGVLKQLFPNVIVDGKIDFDMLRTILGDTVEDNIEKYQKYIQ